MLLPWRMFVLMNYVWDFVQLNALGRVLVWIPRLPALVVRNDYMGWNGSLWYICVEGWKSVRTVTFQKILPRHSNTLTLPVHLYHVRHFGSTCNIVPPGREVGGKCCDLGKSQKVRNFRTENRILRRSGFAYKIDQFLENLAPSGNFW